MEPPVPRAPVPAAGRVRPVPPTERNLVLASPLDMAGTPPVAVLPQALVRVSGLKLGADGATPLPTRLSSVVPSSESAVPMVTLSLGAESVTSPTETEEAGCVVVVAVAEVVQSEGATVPQAAIGRIEQRGNVPSPVVGRPLLG